MTVAKTVHVRANLPRGHEFRLRSGKKVRIEGNAAILRGKDIGIIPTGVYGKTEVPEDDWNQVVKEFGNSKLLKGGLVFAESTAERADAKAREMRELRHGLEAASKNGATQPAEVA